MNPKITDIQDGKITEISVGEFRIPVHVFSVTNWNNKKNIGSIIEEYRKLIKDKKYKKSNIFFQDNKKYILTFLKNLKSPFPEYNPDFVIIFYPYDENRLNFLKCFVKGLKVKNITEIDFSKTFKKKEPEKSITEGLTKKDFVFFYNKTELLKNILLIDDTISEGRTVSILLEFLQDNNLIDQHTIIRLVCAYNNEKSLKLDVNIALNSIKQ